MSIDDWITTEEASQRYGKTKCAWRQACIAGRVTRAALKGGIWLIHQDAARDYAATSKRGGRVSTTRNSGYRRWR